MNKLSNLLWGIVLVLLGVVFGLNALDITDIDIFFDGWWTLFIIVPSFIDLFKEGNKTGSLIGIGVGTCLLLACQDILSFELIWKLMVPCILVIIGLSIIFKDLVNDKVKKEIKKLNKTNNNEYSAIFGSQAVEFSNEVFTGCDLSSVFGEVNCDLRDAIINENVVINVSCVFGSSGIKVPDNVKVKVTSTPIFGGVEDERKNKNKDSDITVYINATCLFGGVEIR